MVVNLKMHVGKQAEREACEFLQQQGLELLASNYHSRAGEIDLIMREKQAIVFVEVRVRNSDKYGDAIDSIDFRKQQKIIKTATLYLKHQQLLDKVNCRFDVIGISYANTKAAIEWIADAFPADDF